MPYDRGGAWVLVVWIIGVGCSKPHVTLVPPPPGLTPEQRVVAFNQLHATAEKTTMTTPCGGGGGCSTSVSKTLYLANGAQVHHAEDLLPVLPRDSESARAIHAARDARSSGVKWGLAGLAAGIAGVLIGFETENTLFFGIGFGAAVVGGIMSYKYHFEAADHGGRANETYNAGLAKTLDVCVAGLGVVPCEAEGAAPIVAPPPQP